MSRLGVVLALAWLTVMAGCASFNITKARQAVSASATLGSTAADLFGVVDAQEQQKIAYELSRDHDYKKAEAARDDWRNKQAISVKALKVYNTTVSGLGALAELEYQNGKLNLGQLFYQLAQAYVPLVDTLKQFGVTLPTGVK